MSTNFPVCSTSISTDEYWLKGPIPEEKAFNIYYEDKDLQLIYTLQYFAPSSTNSNSNGNLIFNPNASNPISFIAQRSGTGYIIYFTVNNTKLYIVSKSNVFVPSPTEQTLIPTNASVADWAPFLAGQGYILQTSSNTTPKWNSYEAVEKSITGGIASLIKDKDKNPIIKQLTAQTIYALTTEIYSF